MEPDSSAYLGPPCSWRARKERDTRHPLQNITDPGADTEGVLDAHHGAMGLYSQMFKKLRQEDCKFELSLTIIDFMAQPQ